MFSYLNSEILPKLIPANSRILAAVSGGPDSVALAHILYCYQQKNPEQNIKVVISHVNHKVREESQSEAEMVERLARQWGFPFILHEFDAKKNAQDSGKSFQEASREWRYARFKEDMIKWGCNLLATAHHLGDQAETVLYRLLRGSGTAGLAGIYPCKDGIIRPLLTVSKEDILEYCRVHGLPYALDKSNFETVYDRNKIRLQLLPYLESEYNARIQEALGRTAELLRWDEEYIDSQVNNKWEQYVQFKDENCLKIDYRAWDEPEAILSRILRRAAATASGEPRGMEYKFIKLLMKEGKKIGWRQDLPNIKVESTKYGFLLFRRESEHKNNKDITISKDWEIKLVPENWYPIPGSNLQIGIFSEEKNDFDILYRTEFARHKILALDAPLVCRVRRPGDKLFFKNLGHKSIKKVYQDKSVPEKRRSSTILVAYNNEVLWIPGIIRSDCCLPDNSFPKLYGLVARIRMIAPN
ncbi:MAG: tRNA lysidine(34) synthetase TilS [Peptococcaceae bacterium]|nr:tRNA lysidine(34) synthetase TilS [Peptococcaceae bacterium]